MVTIEVVSTENAPRFKREYRAGDQRIVVTDVTLFRRSGNFQAFLSVYSASTGVLLSGALVLLDHAMLYESAKRLGIEALVARDIKRDIRHEFASHLQGVP